MEAEFEGVAGRIFVDGVGGATERVMDNVFYGPVKVWMVNYKDVSEM